jgi:hypothetical protein
MNAHPKTLMFVVALATYTAAHAQYPPAGPGPDATKDGAPPATGAPARGVSDRPPSSVDPRVCLEFPTTAQIIACAEKYRPARRHGKA